MSEKSNYDGLVYADAYHLAKHKLDELKSILEYKREQEDVIVKAIIGELAALMEVVVRKRPK